MSEKRKFESISDSASDPDVINDTTSVKRKAQFVAEDEDKQQNDLMIFEDKYQNRYTEDDEEYKKCLERTDIGPPILTNYYGKNRNSDRFRGNDRFGQRGGQRDSGQQYSNYRDNNYHNSYDNRRSNWNRRPYNRY